jgi:hypothetical protein
MDTNLHNAADAATTRNNHKERKEHRDAEAQGSHEKSKIWLVAIEI